VVALVVVLVAAVVGLVLLSGRPRDAGTPRRVPAASSAAWNPADTAYVRAMLWHQQQAHQLASLVQGRTTRPELLRLALGIPSAQSSDVARMTARLHARGPAPGDDIVHPANEPAERWFAGMMAETRLRTLAASTGQRFDFLFVDMLLEHHKGAIVAAGGRADGLQPVGRLKPTISPWKADCSLTVLPVWVAEICCPLPTYSDTWEMGL
jgi:uncharacterized protein (DUF305 family)